jgi:Na+/H+ antiporter NhaD/arsenite permease-like protein
LTYTEFQFIQGSVRLIQDFSLFRVRFEQISLYFLKYLLLLFLIKIFIISSFFVYMYNMAFYKRSGVFEMYIIKMRERKNKRPKHMLICSSYHECINSINLKKQLLLNYYIPPQYFDKWTIKIVTTALWHTQKITDKRFFSNSIASHYHLYVFYASSFFVYMYNMAFYKRSGVFEMYIIKMRETHTKNNG